MASGPCGACPHPFHKEVCKVGPCLCQASPPALQLNFDAILGPAVRIAPAPKRKGTR